MISVIIPTRDRPGPLHRALRSVARQTYRHFEVIVVRDGGHDVEPVIARWQHEMPVTLLESDTPHGVSHARNRGIAVAQGDHIALLDDDDVFLPHHLHAAADALCSRRADTVYGQALVSPTWIEDLPRDRGHLPCKDYTFDPAFLSIANTIHTGAVVTRNPAGGPVRFDEMLHHCEDWDFLLALHAAGHRFARLDTITSVYHQVPRPGAVHSAYRSAPTPFTRARAGLYDRWPPATGRAEEYREWFRRFDQRLDTLIAHGLNVPPHVYEHAVRGLHATFTDRRSPDRGLLNRLLPFSPTTTDELNTGAFAPRSEVTHAAR
ncbi:glycosyltransferase [Streptomyces sp. H27-G5]|uniref:glycosyltransferase family 2 protein n=1 Tax=Streptomyces sp. H27-G5 TaxID=2996698 RepID=UPI002270A351|nr:glycosyltransferase [Streptomyces sp. H27-G5]MCY0923091.1 glycosyltransferase [Streptomyces sp. H27-G5]